MKTINSKPNAILVSKRYDQLKAIKIVIDTTSKLNQRNKSISFSVFDFSTLYTNLPQYKLRSVMGWLINIFPMVVDNLLVSLDMVLLGLIVKKNTNCFNSSQILTRQFFTLCSVLLSIGLNPYEVWPSPFRGKLISVLFWQKVTLEKKTRPTKTLYIFKYYLVYRWPMVFQQWWILKELKWYLSWWAGTQEWKWFL